MTQHIHILGICGTFMGGLALIARSMGHTITGSDANVYPPMSLQLEEQGIALDARLFVGSCRRRSAERFQSAPSN